jgi:pimeloyl-ACP methyl ester carboxylesterase
LPEQLLSDPAYPAQKVPVWICYGQEDPWTPGRRVDRMLSLDPVERVIPLPNVGHCPHDEEPEQVNSLLIDFLQRAKFSRKEINVIASSIAHKGDKSTVTPPILS